MVLHDLLFSFLALFASPEAEAGQCPADLIETAALVEEAALGSTRFLRSYQKPRGLSQTPEDVAIQTFAVAEMVARIQVQASSARYSLRRYKLDDAFERPKSGAAALEQGIGICGNHVAAFLALADCLDIPARPIKFFYKTDKGNYSSHIIVEVMIDGRWRIVDVSRGGFFLEDPADIFSSRTLEDVMEHGVGPAFQTNTPWLAARLALGEDLFFYFDADELQYTRGNSGTLRLRWDGETALFKGFPVWIGRREAGSDQRFALGLDDRTYRLTLDIRGVGGCASSMLDIGDQRIKPEPGELSIDVQGSDVIALSDEDDVCFIKFRSITASPVEPRKAET
ncbi:MAG: transglutaminase domain-containing protein [Pseudomonadota bacterium]